MKICLSNSEGTPCDRTVTGGGRCDLHQLPEHDRKHIRQSMTSIKGRKFRHLKSTGRYLVLLIVLNSCGVARYELNPAVREEYESYRITVENPENNRVNEQDSIKQIIKNKAK